VFTVVKTVMFYCCPDAESLVLIWSWSCSTGLGLGLTNLLLFTSLVFARIGVSICPLALTFENFLPEIQLITMSGVEVFSISWASNTGNVFVQVLVAF